jgi:hypothetical protein
MVHMSRQGGGRSEGGRKSSEGGRGSATKASPAAIERYLKDIEFPADKQELISQARDNGAPKTSCTSCSSSRTATTKARPT